MTSTCPRLLVAGDEEVAELLRWHQHYRHRLLPVAGGLLDQTMFFLETMEFIDRWVTISE